MKNTLSATQTKELEKNIELEMQEMFDSENEQEGGAQKYTYAALIIAIFFGIITAGYGFLGGGGYG